MDWLVAVCEQLRLPVGMPEGHNLIHLERFPCEENQLVLSR